MFCKIQQLGVIVALCFIGVFEVNAQQVMMQGFYWDFPKAGQGYNWSDTLRLKANELATAGITHIWYPPFAGNGSKSGGYDPKDLFIGNVSTVSSAGTRVQIKAMTDGLSAAGITPVADLVYNHRDGGNPENNKPVKDYILNYAGNSNGTCPGTSYKQPYPSDRFRMIVPIGGASAQGAGTYYINISSRTATYSGYKYVFHATTEKTGGSRWSPVVSPDIDLTASDLTSAYSATLGRNYKNKIEFDGDNDEFQLTLSASDFNSGGDNLIIQTINTESGYGNYRIWKIWYDPDGAGPIAGYDIAPVASWNDDGVSGVYKLQFQTYTDFADLPSGRGGLSGSAFRPNYNANGVSSAGGASSTCLGPDWSMQSMDYFYDYDHLQTNARDTLIAWTKWAYDHLGSRGIRMDAVKHFEPNFVSQMLNEMVAVGKTPNLVVGEWYGEENPGIQNWVSSVNAGLTPAAAAAVKPKVFDFPLRFALKNACDNGSDPRNAYYNSLRDGRGMSGYNVVTFVNNHDFRDANTSYQSSLVHNNPILAYAYILTNNQLGVPTIFYPDYYSYPAPNTNYGGDIIGFDYHPVGLPSIKTKINNLIQVLRMYINGSSGVDYLNYNPSSPTNYISSNAGKCLIYQLNATGSVGGKEVIVAINFDTVPLKVDHVIAVRNGVIAGSLFTDILQYSAYPSAVVDAQNRIYMEVPAKSYSVWVQGVNAVLPVALTDFEAKTQQNSIALQWKTTQESGFLGFEIEKSDDARSFRSIAQLTAKGSEKNETTVEYSYNDFEITGKTQLYYRLKMMDKDGGVAYSQIRGVSMEIEHLQITILPNPIAEKFVAKIILDNDSDITFALFDGNGKQIDGFEKNLKKGENQVRLSLENNPTGTFYLRVQDQLSEKIVKIQKQ